VNAAELIRSTRVRHGLTQAEVARRAGTSQPVISAYEHGRRDPTTAMLRQLIAAAGGQLSLSAERSDTDLAPPIDVEEHGTRLLNLLLLVDAIPTRPRHPLLMAPRMVSK